MLELPNVTLISIDGTGKDENHLRALKYSCHQIKFGDVKFVGVQDFGKQDFYSYIPIEKMDYNGYNKFCIVSLPDIIETDYVLIVQDDGFVTNASAWNNSYFEYDYIGAPWPKNHLFFNTQRWPFIHQKLMESGVTYHVGNGGFSFRSKKLITEAKKLHKEEYLEIPEDALIAIGFRKQLETLNLKFAPYEIAKTFSCESVFVENEIHNPENTFGFHGRETHHTLVSRLNNIQLKD